MCGAYSLSLQTGTPLQNRVGELFSLLKLLKADPFAMYYCKMCECKSLSWNMDARRCLDCGHTPYQHFSWWNREILKPIQKFGAQGDGLEAFHKLGLLLGHIMLRRTKMERQDELQLPPKTVTMRCDYFSPEEEDFYKALYTDACTQFSSYVEQGVLLNNYANVFTLITRMRLAACHPWLVTHGNASGAAVQEHVCPMCQDVTDDPVVARCKHVFCRECGASGGLCPFVCVCACVSLCVAGRSCLMHAAAQPRRTR